MAARRLAIVTGGNRGIGKEIARQLLEEGLFVVLGCRNEAKGAAAAHELRAVSDEVAAYALDVNETRSVRSFVERVEKRHGRPAVLVNNAGIFPEKWSATLEGTSTSLWRKTFETNVFGVMRMCREVIPHMKQLRYGRIVNISSGMGQFQGPMGAGSPAYRVSKAAVNALTCTLAAELDGSGILVNSMSPGWVKTDMGGSAAPRSVEEGADTAVWLCLLPSNGPSGRFFRDRKPIPW